MKKALSILLLLFLTLISYGDISFDPPQWEFGTITSENTLTLEVRITNNGENTARINLQATCDCYYPETEDLLLEGGAAETVTFVYDPVDDNGEIEKFILVRSDVSGQEKLFYPLTGTVENINPDTTAENVSEIETTNPDGQKVKMYYYYSPGCKKCERFIADTLPETEKKLDVSFSVTTRNILDDAGLEELLAVLANRNMTPKGYPAIIVGTTILQGEGEIATGFEQAIKTYLENPTELSEFTDGSLDADLGETVPEISIIPTFIGGLLDGINPCAFTTLIFLLSALAVAGKSRKEILIIGICFAASVFISYFLIGLGLFNALRLAEEFSLVSLIIKWVLTLVLVVFAGISFYDYYLVKAGKSKEILLQLPDLFKRKIRDTVRQTAKSTALAISSITMGVLVSIFELACTGQIYFPTITLIARKTGSAEAFGLLATYNIGFILPLIAVFAATYMGITSKKLGDMFQKHLGKVKLAIGILFLGLAALSFFS